jgi:hypothetical protein
MRSASTLQLRDLTIVLALYDMLCLHTQRPMASISSSYPDPAARGLALKKGHAVIDQRKIRLFFQLIGQLAVVGLIILSFVPGSLRPHTGAPGPVEHIAAYFLTAGFLSYGFGKSRSPAIIVLFLSIFSGAVEIVQLYIPDRHSDFIDFVASTTGACIGAALAWIVLRALSSDFAKAEDLPKS